MDIYAKRRATIKIILAGLLFVFVMYHAVKIKPSEASQGPQRGYLNCLQPQILTKAFLGDRITGNCLVTDDETNLNGKLPPVNATEVIYRGNRDLKRVAITIDDGWNADMRILDLLKAWDIKWTAFLIGGRNLAEAHPEFVKRIEESGGEVCNHTYSHYLMAAKDKPFVVGEIEAGQETITRVTHKIFPYVRYFGGECDPPALIWAREMGYWVVNWTIDSEDTRKGVTTDYQVNLILSTLRPGAIILFHFGGYNTFDVMNRVIPEIQRQGYEVTSLTRVLEGTPFQLNAKKPEVKVKTSPKLDTAVTNYFLPKSLLHNNGAKGDRVK